jgi:cysteine synthase A
MIDNRIRLYIGLSFVAGVLLTLGFKDVYPDLERRFRRKLRRLRRSYSLTSIRAVQLRDNTDDIPDDITDDIDPIPQVHIPEGIEGCIGNTPLFKIRSLSEETGCEILAKAEFLNGAGNSPKDRVALQIIQEVRLHDG